MSATKSKMKQVRMPPHVFTWLERIAAIEGRKSREVLQDLVQRRWRELLIEQTGKRYERLRGSAVYGEELTDWQSTTGDTAEVEE